MEKKYDTVGQMYLGNENLKELDAPDYKKMSKSGAITIPSHIRKQLGLNPEDRFQLEVDENTGNITLKRIEGTCALSYETTNLFNYNGRKLSINTAVEIYSIVVEIMETLSKEAGKKVTLGTLTKVFDSIWNEGDTFKTNPYLNKSAFLRSLDLRDREIKEELEKEQKKSKPRKSKTSKSVTMEDFMKKPVLERLTEDEANELLKVVKLRQLRKEQNNK